jgi:acetoin utilization protein AcuB
MRGGGNMLVKRWMHTDVVTVGEETPMPQASIKMKKYHIRSLLVVKKDKLTGIITDRDLRNVSPSPATSLNVHELNYLLSRVKVKEIMSRDIVLVRSEETVEFAAMLMLDNKISSLPVVDDSDDLIGIITQTDIFRALVTVGGAYRGGIKFVFSLEDRSGSIKEVADEIRSFGARLISILSTYEGAEKGRHHVYIRIQSISDKKTMELKNALEKKFYLLYFVHDHLNAIETRRSGVSHFPIPYALDQKEMSHYVS